MLLSYLYNIFKAPIQVYGLEGRYAHALFSAAAKKKSLESVEVELNKFQVHDPARTTMEHQTFFTIHYNNVHFILICRV